MSFWSDLMQYGYLQNAFWAALLSGVACALVGCYVVARRMVFLAGGITHASFGGLGIAFWAGTNPIIGALLFAVGSALGIEWASEKGRIRSDSAIGILWAVGMATGALFMSLRPGYTSGDMTAYLFGSIITVTHGDIAALALLTAGLVVGALCWLRPLFYVAFDRDYAHTRGIATRTVSYLMAALMALTIVLSIRVMGIVLLVALITIPAVVANTLSRDYRRMALIAPVVGVIGNLTGLILSYQWDIAPGVAIIFTLLVGLIAVKLLTLWHKNAQAQE
ncbi:MAG: metal ABC transporter permease [Rikenellaceae bacterium]|nr:metal ABC transporter permease [Rikenellaceae bacterium]